MSHHDHHNHDSMHGSSITTADPHAGHDSMDHSSMDHSSMDHSSMDHGMKMYFHASNEATILFYSWTTTTAAGMFGSCMAVMILSLLYEGLKVLRDRLLSKAEIKRTKFYKNKAIPLATVDNHCEADETKVKSYGMVMFSKDHFFQTLLHIIQIGVSYLLMLIFMTYNVWLCLAVIAGAALGYFLFGWMKTRLVHADEYCH